MVVIGHTDPIDWKLPPKELIDSVHTIPAIVIVAHPGADDPWILAALTDYRASGVDAFETRRDTPQFYLQWKKLGRLPGLVSSTDSHDTTFSKPVRTIVFARANDTPQIIEAVRTGYSLGYTIDNLFGSDTLIDVFNTLLEEGQYLKNQHSKRLTTRARSLYPK